MLYNRVFPRKSPLIALDELARLGYDYCLQADVLYAVSYALRDFFHQFKHTGRYGIAAQRMITFDQFNDIVGLARIVAAENQYEPDNGLVTLSPNRGAYVTSVELTGAREFFEALEVSQRVATRWAALRRGPTDLQAIDRHRLAFEAAVVRRDVGAMIEINIEFHKAIATACGNTHVLREYTHLLALGFRLSQSSLNSRDRDSGYYDSAHLQQAIVEEHRRMAASITQADADTADRLASEHVTRFRNKILAHLARTRAGEIEL